MLFSLYLFAIIISYLYVFILINFILFYALTRESLAGLRLGKVSNQRKSPDLIRSTLISFNHTNNNYAQKNDPGNETKDIKKQWDNEYIQYKAKNPNGDVKENYEKALPGVEENKSRFILGGDNNDGTKP